MPVFCQKCQTLGHECPPVPPPRRARARNKNPRATEQWAQVRHRPEVANNFAPIHNNVVEQPVVVQANQFTVLNAHVD